MKCIWLNAELINKENNPVKNLYAVNEPFQTFDADWQVELFNSLGQEVYNCFSANNNFIFNHVGLYIYKVYNKRTGRMQSGKLVVN